MEMFTPNFHAPGQEANDMIIEIIHYQTSIHTSMLRDGPVA